MGTGVYVRRLKGLSVHREWVIGILAVTGTTSWAYKLHLFDDALFFLFLKVSNTAPFRQTRHRHIRVASRRTIIESTTSQ